MAIKQTWGDSLREKVDTLKQSIDLRDLFLERYPGRFRRAGRWLYGPSPYRPDEHPSFAVNEDVFIDFATGDRGDEVDFVQREQGASFAEAIEVLEARIGGVSSFQPSTLATQTTSVSEPPPAAWQAVMRAECRRAHAYLFSNVADAQQARAWLKQRGIKPHTLHQAGIGYNPAWRRTRLRDVKARQRVSIAPGILIPWFGDGALWGVHVRTIPEIQVDKAEAQDLPKYLYVRGSKASTLYNGDALEADTDVLMVEGEFDALLAQQALGKEVIVVTAGGAANPVPRRWLYRLQQAKRVYSCLDKDDAGRRAAARLQELLGAQHQALSLPRGKDITEFVIDYGGDLRAWWRGEIERLKPLPVQLSFLDDLPTDPSDAN
jgi:DNA primase